MTRIHALPSIALAATVLAATCGACAGDDDSSAETTADAADEIRATDLGGDASAPLDVAFLELRSEEISDVRAVVRFDTSIATTCAVVWGTDPDALDRTSVDPDMAPGQLSHEHEVPLEDLAPETTYFWRGFVELPNDNASALSELQSFTTLTADASGPAMRNVALASEGGQIAGVSSNFGGGANDATWGADSAIDGQMATEWSSDGDGDDAWLELELPAPTRLDGFGFRSRMMTDGSSIIESVQLVVDGELTLGPFETPDPDQLYTFTFEEPVAATRVRVEAVHTTGGNTGAREIQLLVAPSSQDVPP